MAVKQIAVINLPNGKYTGYWSGYYIRINNRVYPTFVREISKKEKKVQVTVMNRRVYYV